MTLFSFTKKMGLGPNNALSLFLEAIKSGNDDEAIKFIKHLNASQKMKLCQFEFEDSDNAIVGHTVLSFCVQNNRVAVVVVLIEALTTKQTVKLANHFISIGPSQENTVFSLAHYSNDIRIKTLLMRGMTLHECIALYANTLHKTCLTSRKQKQFEFNHKEMLKALSVNERFLLSQYYFNDTESIFRKIVAFQNMDLGLMLIDGMSAEQIRTIALKNCYQPNITFGQINIEIACKYLPQLAILFIAALDDSACETILRVLLKDRFFAYDFIKSKDIAVALFKRMSPDKRFNMVTQNNRKTCISLKLSDSEYIHSGYTALTAAIQSAKTEVSVAILDDMEPSHRMILAVQPLDIFIQTSTALTHAIQSGQTAVALAFLKGTSPIDRMPLCTDPQKKGKENLLKLAIQHSQTQVGLALIEGFTPNELYNLIIESQCESLRGDLNLFTLALHHGEKTIAMALINGWSTANRLTLSVALVRLPCQIQMTGLTYALSKYATSVANALIEEMDGDSLKKLGDSMIKAGKHTESVFKYVARVAPVEVLSSFLVAYSVPELEERIQIPLNLEKFDGDLSTALCLFLRTAYQTPTLLHYAESKKINVTDLFLKLTHRVFTKENRKLVGFEIALKYRAPFPNLLTLQERKTLLLDDRRPLANALIVLIQKSHERQLIGNLKDWLTDLTLDEIAKALSLLATQGNENPIIAAAYQKKLYGLVNYLINLGIPVPDRFSKVATQPGVQHEQSIHADTVHHTVSVSLAALREAQPLSVLELRQYLYAIKQYALQLNQKISDLELEIKTKTSEWEKLHKQINKILKTPNQIGSAVVKELIQEADQLNKQLTQLKENVESTGVIYRAILRFTSPLVAKFTEKKSNVSIGEILAYFWINRLKQAPEQQQIALEVFQVQLAANQREYNTDNIALDSPGCLEGAVNQLTMTLELVAPKWVWVSFVSHRSLALKALTLLPQLIEADFNNAATSEPEGDKAWVKRYAATPSNKALHPALLASLHVSLRHALLPLLYNDSFHPARCAVDPSRIDYLFRDALAIIESGVGHFSLEMRQAKNNIDSMIRMLCGKAAGKRPEQIARELYHLQKIEMLDESLQKDPQTAYRAVVAIQHLDTERFDFSKPKCHLLGYHLDNTQPESQSIGKIADTIHYYSQYASPHVPDKFPKAFYLMATDKNCIEMIIHRIQAREAFIALKLANASHSPQLSMKIEFNSIYENVTWCAALINDSDALKQIFAILNLPLEPLNQAIQADRKTQEKENKHAKLENREAIVIKNHCLDLINENSQVIYQAILRVYINSVLKHGIKVTLQAPKPK